MLDCCKDASTIEPKSSMSSKPTYKYSFRKRDYILVNPGVGNQSQTYLTEAGSKVWMPPDNAAQQLRAIKEEHHKLDLYTRDCINPLTREVEFFEEQVYKRAHEIDQLNQLLEKVVQQRRSLNVPVRNVGLQ